MGNVKEYAVSLALVCPIIQGMKRNMCDYPQLRKKLSSQTRKRCACAGEKGNECVLRHIYVGDRNIVQRVLFHEEFKARGDKDPTEEIRQAIRAYEKQDSLTSLVWRLMKKIYFGVDFGWKHLKKMIVNNGVVSS